jgi:integrase
MPKRRGHGEGSIYQRADGKWIASVDLGVVAGKRQRKVMTGRTRKEASIKLQQALAAKSSNTLVSRTTSVEKWLRYWLEVICPERGLKVNTLKSHRSKVERYLIPGIGAHRLDKLEPEHIRAMYAAMRARGLSESTIRQTHAVLGRALKVAVRERKLATNPATMMDPPKVPDSKRTGLAIEDARKVLAAAGDDPRWFLALLLGMRQGEVLALRWSDVDLAAGVLHVERSLSVKPGAGFVFETPKTVLSRAPLPLPTVVLSRLAVLRARHAQSCPQVGRTGACVCLLFAKDDGSPIHPRADYARWKALLERAGVAHVPLHAARNTTATLLRATGVTAQDQRAILRHTTIAMTEHYQDDDIDRKRASVAALEAALGD